MKKVIHCFSLQADDCNGRTVFLGGCGAKWTSPPHPHYPFTSGRFREHAKDCEVYKALLSDQYKNFRAAF